MRLKRVSWKTNLERCVDCHEAKHWRHQFSLLLISEKEIKCKDAHVASPLPTSNAESCRLRTGWPIVTRCNASSMKARRLYRVGPELGEGLMMGNSSNCRQTHHMGRSVHTSLNSGTNLIAIPSYQQGSRSRWQWQWTNVQASLRWRRLKGCWQFACFRVPL